MATSSTSPVIASGQSLPSTAPTIDIRAIVRRHGSVAAVDHVSFQVQRGEFFSILGPSGAGKTSVLRIVAGFEHPDEGDVLIDGRSMIGVPPNRRPVNLVFQSYALFPHLTVSENVAFGLKMRRVPAALIDEQVRQALAMVKLIGKEARKPAQLSGGEQQRVALARALVNKPAVVLLDEPLAALDQQLRQAMQVELKSIQEQAGLTCVCVTHHQEEAMMMSDRIAVMHQGRMLQVGTPREVYENPRNLLVSRFLGVSNELSGRLSDVVGEEHLFQPADDRLPGFPVHTVPGQSSGGPATWSLRPERLRMSRERPATQDPVLPGLIEKVLFAGSETKYLIRVGRESLWEARMSGAAQQSFAAGEPVCLHWALTDGRVFVE
ncbi:MAG: ATP-binding cassette domain-containing protein [Nitrospira sp. CR1.1]|nr:ATP-binding cassette domain-containing protein [Nitrospira sp. CR1.1]